MLHALLTIITPDTCLICGIEGSLLCRDCSKKISSTAPSRCFFCFRTTTDDKCCDTCYRRTGVQSVIICGEYKDTLKRLLFSYKFEHNRAASSVLAELLIDRAPLLPEGVVISYIPTAYAHIRERGFDHAKLLAKKFAIKQQIVAVPLLTRLTQTTQRGATRSTRIQNMTHAFEVRHRAELRGKHIVIVDDVITTGATVRAATKVLLAAGASRVTILAVARA